jgi:mannose-6-phosphate isomerase-like protein (cupin superfamily)
VQTTIPQNGQEKRNKTERSNGVIVLLHRLKRLAGVAQRHKGSVHGFIRAVPGDRADVAVLVQSHISNERTSRLLGQVERPWGSFTILDAGVRFKVKRIAVQPGEKLSLQKHYHRAEHWIVVSGTAKVTIGDRNLLVHENESVAIPKSTSHRLENPGKVLLQIIEVQSGEYLEEDDIVRIDDSYGRN